MGKRIHYRQAACGFTTVVQGVCSIVGSRAFIPVCVCFRSCMCACVCANKSCRRSRRRRKSAPGRWEPLGVLSWNRSQQALACQPVLYIHIHFWRQTMQPKAEAQQIRESGGGKTERWTQKQTGKHVVGMPAHKRRASVFCDA